MALDPYIARGVQPIDVTNALYQGANLRMEQQRANAIDQRNALLDRRWEQQNQRAQEAAAKEERERRKEAAGPLLYRAIKDGNQQARDIAYEFAVEDYPEFGNMPREVVDTAIFQGLEKTYGEQLKPNPTRTRLSGGMEVQEEFDSKTGKWSEIGRGSRWAPQQAPQPVNSQLVTRPVDGGLVQDFAWNPRTNAMVPTGKPYKPADAKADKPLGEKDKTVGLLFGSIVGAEKDIADATKAGGPTTASKWNAALDAVPFDRGVFRNLQSDKYRKYESAALRWSANLLYIKSGATAPPEEVRSTYRQFFPQPGDGDETIKQKALAREQEKQNIRAMYPEAVSRYPDAATGEWSIEEAP